MSHRMLPGRRIAGLAAIIGLIGSGMTGLALADSPAGSSFLKSMNPGGRPPPASPSPFAARVPRAARSSAGMRLLRQAAAACRDTSYRGSQVMLWRGQGETSSSVVEVWHRPGRMILVQAAGTPSGGPGAAAQPGAADDQDPDGIFGVSGRLLTLLQSNYLVVYTGLGSARQRPALVVEVRRPGGGLAARFWLDAATKLPLRRQLFDAHARVISDDAFTRLELGDPDPGGPAAAAAAPWPARLDQASLAALRAKGWRLPGRLPGNLSLFAATQTSTHSGPVVNLSYSDGLAVVSLFVQRGKLGRAMPGWRPVTLRGRTVYSVNPKERTFAWSAGGFVYTLIGDAPMLTLSQVVAALPGPARLGFWPRMARGLHRIASWLDPLP